MRLMCRYMWHFWDSHSATPVTTQGVVTPMHAMNPSATGVKILDRPILHLDHLTVS